MSQLRIWLVVFLLLLVASNAVWASLMLRKEAPAAVSSYGCTENEQYFEMAQESIFPLASAVQASLKPGASRASIVAAAQAPQSFSTQECTLTTDVRIADYLGLRFEGDRLVAVSTVPCVH
jgi:hypothetical protein